MKEDIEPIEADFEVIRTQTMQSNAVRVVLDASEQRTDLLQIFADAQRGGYIMKTVFLMVRPDNDDDDWID
ncbi:MAG: hypothetical protein HN975_06170 [Anaerolineae bacterium]|jgi:hypothetical protein|nr:hypothetical protein [Anaerolineae bacterium]